MAKKERVKKPIYKKWWFWLVVAVIVIAAIGGEEEKEVKKEAAKEPIVEVKAVTQEEFEAYAQNITGGSFIKSITVADNKGAIEYYGTFEEYKAAKPESKVDEAMYNSYFETGDAISKILVGENVRLLRQFPNLVSTSMVLTYKGKTYSIDLERKEVNNYLGFKVEELNIDDESWNDKFVDPIVYDDTNRQKFFNKFVKVQ